MADDGGEELRPATRAELVEGLSFALRYQGRRRVNDAPTESFMARIAAERLVDYLQQSRFVVMKRSPPPAPSDAAYRRSPPLKD